MRIVEGIISVSKTIMTPEDGAMQTHTHDVHATPRGMLNLKAAAVQSDIVIVANCMRRCSKPPLPFDIGTSSHKLANG